MVGEHCLLEQAKKQQRQTNREVLLVEPAGRGRKLRFSSR